MTGVSLGRLARRLCTTAAVAALATVSAVCLDTGAAQALGPGEVCVFLQPYGASGAGHVGYGYLIGGTSQYVFGSTENPNGAASVPASGFNGAWHAQGTKAQMIDAFTHQWHYPSTRKDRRSVQSAPTHSYMRYKCETTDTSAVGAANTALAAAEASGYRLAGNNCMDHAYRILRAYGAPDLPSPTFTIAPNIWFDALNTGKRWRFYEIRGEHWIHPPAMPTRVIDVSISFVNGTPLKLWDFNDGNNQRWIRVEAGNGYFKLLNRHSDRCMDVKDRSMDNRAALNHWDCYNTDSQQWKFEFKGRYINGYPVYQLRNKLSGRCVDAEDLGTTNGTRLVQWTCNGGTNQEWY